MKTVELGSSEYFIEEHLAVHAAKLFFLSKKPSEVEKALIDLQARLTSDASSFDKHAEWFLAWVCLSLEKKTWIPQDADSLGFIEIKPTICACQRPIDRFHPIAAIREIPQLARRSYTSPWGTTTKSIKDDIDSWREDRKHVQWYH